MRKVSLLISIVILLGLGYWAFSEFVQQKNEKYDLLSAIPADALLILEKSDGSEKWKDFYTSSMLWKDFENTQFAKKANKLFAIMDSLQIDPAMIISLHPAEEKEDLLISIAIDASVENALNNSTRFEQEINTLDPDLQYSIEKKCIYLSNSEALLSKARTLKDRSILSDSSFNEISSQVKSVAVPRLFIRLESFSKAFNRRMIGERFDLPNELHGWMGVDVRSKANSMVLSGFLNFNEEKAAFFSAYEGQHVQGLNYFDILPANTSVLRAGSFGNPGIFLQKASDLDSAQINFLTTWMGNAFGRAMLNNDLEEKSFSFIQIRDKESFNEALKELVKEDAKTNYRSVAIEELKIGGIFHELFESDSSELYVCDLQSYAVFSKEKEVIKEIIRRHGNDNTLSLQESFSNLRDELSDESSFLFYISPAMAQSFLSEYLSPEIMSYYIPEEGSLAMLQAMIIQLSSYKKGKLYLHSMARHQAVNFQEKDNSLWELSFEAPIEGDIHILRNHYTQHNEIMVQDSNDIVYVLNNKGEIQWKKQLDGAILGPVKQLDIYKNGKLQILLNTPSSIYCFDRLGNNVAEFPVKLKQKTNLGHALFDYDNSKNYRILMAFPDGSMQMFNAEGQKVRGWKFGKARSPIMETPQHIRIGKKDYIYTSTGNGSIFLLDRQGKSRYRSKVNIADKKGAAYFYSARNIQNSGIYYVDSLGSVVNVPFGGEKQYTDIKGNKGDELYMARITDDNSREFILWNENGLQVFDLSGQKLYERSDIGSLNTAPRKFRFDQQNWLGYSDDASFSAMILNAQGEEHQDSPFSGLGSFRMADINKDGTLELIIKNEDGGIVVYSINK